MMEPKQRIGIDDMNMADQFREILNAYKKSEENRPHVAKQTLDATTVVGKKIDTPTKHEAEITTNNSNTLWYYAKIGICIVIIIVVIYIAYRIYCRFKKKNEETGDMIGINKTSDISQKKGSIGKEDLTPISESDNVDETKDPNFTPLEELEHVANN